MVNKMIRIVLKLTFTIAVLLLGACARIVTVDVNAIVDPNLAKQQKQSFRYILLANNNTSKDDLYFKEFSHYFIKALKQNGYVRSDDKSKADMEIVFSYGLSDGRSGVYTYAAPIYEFIGGEIITIKQESSGEVTTIHIPSRYERVGTSLESQEYTYYIAHATLEARAVSDGMEKPEILWSVQMQSKVATDDLRKVMPYMAHAARPYIGKNSGHQISVNIKENDPKVIDSGSFKHK